MRQSRSLSTVHRLTAAAAENSAARSFVRFPEAHAGTSGSFSGLSGADSLLRGIISTESRSSARLSAVGGSVTRKKSATGMLKCE